jgi:hypothetical protein
MSNPIPLRVLKPGGHVFIHTAFLPPLHEPPWHFFNCTKFGLQQWFAPFEIVSLQVSENFNPIYALAWQADELLRALRTERGTTAGERIEKMPLKDLTVFWNRPASRKDPIWKDFFQLSQATQERLAAGFELIARKAYLLTQILRSPRKRIPRYCSRLLARARCISFVRKLNVILGSIVFSIPIRLERSRA